MTVYNTELHFEKLPLKNIAIFRALFLGDMLCVIPTVRALRATYPHAKITLVGLPWEEKFVQRFHIYFDDFIAFPGWPGLAEQTVMLNDIPNFIKEIQSQKFDLVLQMQGNGCITNNLCMLWDAKKVCGLRREFDYCPDQNFFPVSEDDEHEVLRFLKLVDALNVPRQGVDLEFFFHEEEIKNFKAISEQLQLPDGKYICLHPGARDVRRRWAPDNFAYVASRLAAEGYTVVLTGSEDERSLLQDVKDHTQYPVIDIVEKLGNVGIGELAAITGHSALLISNDTCVSQIAAALRVPSLIIFSSFSNLSRWAPLDRVLHRTVSADQANHPKKVVDLIFELLNQQNKKGTRSLVPF